MTKQPPGPYGIDLSPILRRRCEAIVLLLASGVAVAASCAQQAPDHPPSTLTVPASSSSAATRGPVTGDASSAHSATGVSSTALAASAPPVASTSTGEPAPAERPACPDPVDDNFHPVARPFKKGFIPCGHAHCNARTEMCCASTIPSTTCYGCAPRVEFAFAPQTEEERLFPTIHASKSCELRGVRENFIDYCAGTSSNCPAGQVCCGNEEWVPGSFSASTCKPIGPHGQSPCNTNESCVGGQPCRLPGTLCRGRTCMKSRSTVNCGSQTCSGNASCCWNKGTGRLACAARCTGDDAYTFGCTTTRDCVAGERCFMPSYDNTTAQCSGEGVCSQGCGEVCRTDADCAGSMIGNPYCNLTFGGDKVPEGYGMCDSR